MVGMLQITQWDRSGFWCWLSFYCRFSCLCGWRLCHHLQLKTNPSNPFCINAAVSKFGIRILHQPQMQRKVTLRNTHKVVSTYQLCRLRVALAEAFNTGLQAFSFIIAVRTADSSTTGESQSSHRYSSCNQLQPHIFTTYKVDFCSHA